MVLWYRCETCIASEEYYLWELPTFGNYAFRVFKSAQNHFSNCIRSSRHPKSITSRERLSPSPKCVCVCVFCHKFSHTSVLVLRNLFTNEVIDPGKSCRVLLNCSETTMASPSCSQTRFFSKESNGCSFERFLIQFHLSEK